MGRYRHLPSALPPGAAHLRKGRCRDPRCLTAILLCPPGSCHLPSHCQTSLCAFGAFIRLIYKLRTEARAKSQECRCRFAFNLLPSTSCSLRNNFARGHYTIGKEIVDLAPWHYYEMRSVLHLWKVYFSSLQVRLIHPRSWTASESLPTIAT